MLREAPAPRTPWRYHSAAMTPTPHLAILAALEEELESVHDRLVDPIPEPLGSFQALRGRFGGCDVVVARTGIGKVSAALHTQSILSHCRPRAVLFTGVAGSLVPWLKVGDLVIGTQAIQHDYDLTAFDRAPGFVPIGADLESGTPTLYAEAMRVLGKQSVERLQGVAYFDTSPELRRLAFEAYDELASRREMPAAVAGTIASGDRFVADPGERRRIQRMFGALCVEMEGAAAAQVCYLGGVPFLLLRAISDEVEGAAAQSFDRFAREAAARNAELLEGVARNLAP